MIPNGHRKLTAFLIGMGVASIALFVGKLPASLWVDFAKFITLVFVAGNVVEWFKKY